MRPSNAPFLPLRTRRPLRARRLSPVAAATVSICAVAIQSALAVPASAQRPQAGWKIAGVPALNYNSDDRFGYGAVLEIYRYGADTTLPYALTIQPTVFRTTGGRRDYTLFVDVPRVAGSRWRLSGFAGHETHRAAPYYGVGNDTQRDRALEEPPNERYYRYERERVQFLGSLQARVGRTPLRVAAGGGLIRTRIGEIPRGATASYLDDERGGEPAPEGWTNFARIGLGWDTRDREIHTRRGTYVDVLVQRFDARIGSDWDFTRTTVTARKFVPVAPRVTLAGRVLVQNVSGDAPLHELAVIQTNFRPQEGLGGASSVRGIPRSRFVGRGLALSNAEVRWRAREGQSASLTLSAFVDAGRVWENGVELGSATTGLKTGAGLGARLGLGPNFVVGLDVGHSKEATAPIYLGLGFLF